nr:alpha,alpha-trehalose-phosphate synthase [UDP-forming] 1-like [Tanacetum cinerariifolium]
MDSWIQCCFYVVLECVLAPVATVGTSPLEIPAISVAAYPFCIHFEYGVFLRMPNKKWIRNLAEVQMDWVDSVKVRYLQVYNGLEENGVRSSDDGVKNESEKDDVEESKARRDYNKVKRPLTLEENVTTTESPKRKK